MALKIVDDEEVTALLAEAHGAGELVLHDRDGDNLSLSIDKHYNEVDNKEVPSVFVATATVHAWSAVALDVRTARLAAAKLLHLADELEKREES